MPLSALPQPSRVLLVLFGLFLFAAEIRAPLVRASDAESSITPEEVERYAPAPEAVRRHVTRLAECGTRMPGSQGHERAKTYIVETLRESGYADATQAALREDDAVPATPLSEAAALREGQTCAVLQPPPCQPANVRIAILDPENDFAGGTFLLQGQGLDGTPLTEELSLPPARAGRAQASGDKPFRRIDTVTARECRGLPAAQAELRVGYDRRFAIGLQRFWGVAPHDPGDGRLTFAEQPPPAGAAASYPLYALWPNGTAVTSTGRNGLRAPLLYARSGRLQDFDGLPVDGALVLLDLPEGGGEPGCVGWTLAAGLGAAGVLYIEPEQAQRPATEKLFVSSPVEFPRFWVPRKEGLALREVLQAAAVRGTWPQAVARTSMTWKSSLWENIYLLVPGSGKIEGQLKFPLKLKACLDGLDLPTPELQARVEGVKRLLLPERVLFSELGPALSGLAGALDGQAAAKVREYAEETQAELDSTVVLAAYYDSTSAVPALAPGAEQALSCATLLELARQFKQAPPPRDVLLVFFTGHGQGLKGEREFFAEVERFNSAGREQLPDGVTDGELARTRGQGRILREILRQTGTADGPLSERLTREQLLEAGRQAVARYEASEESRTNDQALETEREAQGGVSAGGAWTSALLILLGLAGFAYRDAKRRLLAASVLVAGLVVLSYGVLLPALMRAYPGGGKIADAAHRVDDLLDAWREETAAQESEVEREVRRQRNTGPREGALARLEKERREYEQAGRHLYALSSSGPGAPPPLVDAAVAAKLAETARTVLDRLEAEGRWVEQEWSRRQANASFCALVRDRLSRAAEERTRRKSLFLSLDLSAGNPGLGLFYKGALYNQPEIESKYVGAWGRVVMPIARAVEKAAGAAPGLLMPDTLPPKKRRWETFLGTPLALSAEVAVQAQMRGLTLATPYDRRMNWDTPQDLPGREGLNWKHVASQLRLAGAFLHFFLAEGAVSEESRFEAGAKYTGFSQLIFKTVRRGGSRSLFPNLPVSGTLIQLVAQPPHAAGVRLGLYEATHPLGLARLAGVRRSARWSFEVTRSDPESGEIVYALNKPRHQLDENGPFSTQVSGARSKKETLELFRAQGLAILNIIDPRFLTTLANCTVLAGQTESKPLEFGASYPYRQSSTQNLFAEPHRVIFAEPGSRVKLLFREGQFGLRLAVLDVDVRQVLPRLLNRETSSEVSPAEARGPGYPLGSRKVLDGLPLRGATDLWCLGEQRLGDLRKRSISNARLDNPDYPGAGQEPGLHNLAQERLMEAHAAQAQGHVAEAWQRATEAWALEARGYPEVLETAKDSVLGVVFYLFLLLPFCFFAERLLFACAHIERQIAAFFTLFVALFMLLWLVHPAFQLIAAPPMILLAFVIMSLTGIVIVIVYSKFNAEMRLLQQGVQGVQAADVNRASAGLVAISLGISQMRRRKLRTTLTCITVVLLTFTALSFTSVVQSLAQARIDLSPGLEKDAPYSGLLLRQLNFDSLRDEAFERLRTELEAQGARCVPRYWLASQKTGATGQNANRPVFHDLLTEDGRTASAAALLGLAPEERELFPELAQSLEAGNWLAPGARDVCLLPLPLAEQLKLGQRPDGSWTPAQAVGQRIFLAGYPLTVTGVFRPEAFQEVRDLDGEPLTPVEFTRSSASRGAEQNTGESAGVENLASATISLYEHISAAQTLVLPWTTAALLGADLRSVAVRLAEPQRLEERIGSILLRLQKNLFVGLDGRRYLYASTGKLSLTGLGNLVVPLLICALILLNVMLGAVYERGREIHIFSALGLAPSHVAALFLAEAMVYATLGALLGYLLGQGVAQGVQAAGIEGLYLNYSSSSAVFVTALVMLAVTGSALYPALLAAKAAAPSEERSWSVPAPVGDEIALELPFSFQRDLVPGVAIFLHEYFDSHVESSLGRFTAKEVTLEAFHTERGQGICLFFLAWLRPYDLGVSQETQIYIVPQSEGLYVSEAAFYRLSGYVDSWRRVNLPFLHALRKHLLLWRTFSPQQRQEYAVRGYYQFQEAFEAVGWPPPEGFDPTTPDPDLLGPRISAGPAPAPPSAPADEPVSNKEG